MKNHDTKIRAFPNSSIVKVLICVVKHIIKTNSSKSKENMQP